MDGVTQLERKSQSQASESVNMPEPNNLNTMREWPIDISIIINVWQRERKKTEVNKPDCPMAARPTPNGCLRTSEYTVSV